MQGDSLQATAGQTPPPAPPGETGSGATTQPGFKRLGEAAEAHSGYNLMVAAYAVLWVILMGWLFLLWRKQAGLHMRIDDLEREIDKATAKQAAVDAR